MREGGSFLLLFFGVCVRVDVNVNEGLKLL